MGDKQIWLMEITSPAEEVEKIQALLADSVQYGWEERPAGEDAMLFAIYSENPDFLASLRSEMEESGMIAQYELKEVPKADWLAAWKEFFTPVECGNQFVILPPWLAHLEHRMRKVIVIEPKSAFGTGHHASTRLCLAALGTAFEAGELNRKGWCLDLGCGTGVLGLAACKLGMNSIGLDIDPVAIANARENRELNDITTLELLKGGIEKVKGEKFDLVMANILAKPLEDLAPLIVKALKKDAILILGGILLNQAEEVSAIYEREGLKKPEIFREDEWVALLYRAAR